MGPSCRSIRLAHSQRVEVADVLAGAFHNDPAYRYLIPDDTVRARVLPWLFDRVTYYSLRYGEAYTTPEVEGAAFWLPPGQSDITFGRVIRTGLIAIPLKLGWAAYRRLMDITAYEAEVHKRFAPGSHWYLWVLGVKTSSQGKGIGGELLQPVLTSARASKTPCFLETNTERNVRFYQKHGFRVVSDSCVPGHGLRMWALLFEP